MASGGILEGLLTTEKWDGERYKNPRREIFKQYPNGGMALTGILSMLDSEVTNDPQYTVYEERFRDVRTLTAQANSAGPFTDTSDVDLTAGGFTQAAGTTVRVHVADPDLFTVDAVVRIFNVSTTGVATELEGIITAIDKANNHMNLLLTGSTAWTNILNSTANNGLYLEAIGTAVKEGSDENNFRPFKEPVETYNLTQIFKKAFKITNTAQVTDLKYDKSGPTKKQYQDTALEHMLDLEAAFLWGSRNKYSSGETLIRQTGGLMWYLGQWELGTVYKNSSTAITSFDDDQKRIINMTSWKNGVLTEATMDTLAERIFRTSMNKTNEKFVCAGSGFLKIINQLYKSKSVIHQDVPSKDTYGMEITTLKTPFGRLHFYSHPRFSNNPRTRNSAFIIDFNHLKYVYMNKRDTLYLAKVQSKKADYREDMFLTEAGIKALFPETMMYIEGVTSYEP